MLIRNKLSLWMLLLLMMLCALPGISQERQRTITTQDSSEEILRINARVVFLDALVKDRKTNEPVRNLTKEDFKVLDDGKPRTLTYFSRGGEERRPLAVVLCLNLDYMGARRYLERDDVRASLAAALTKLSPKDEVAVMSFWETMGGKPIILADLTRDRTKAIAAALAPPQNAATSATERAVLVMNEAVQKAVDIAVRERPDSQVVFVYVSDGLATNDLLEFSNRQKLATKLIENNVMFSALTFDMLKGMAAATAIGNVPLRILGASMTGGEQYLAKQTGGIAVKVDKPEDLGTGLQQITSDLASRYSLGFTLDEDEKAADGQMRKLEVKVEARDMQGKKRKLMVSARRGYYIPKK